MKTNTIKTAARAYAEALRTVLDEGEVVAASEDVTSVATNFGVGRPGTLEVLGAVVSVDGPDLSLPVAAIRRPDPFFAVANLLWILSGSDAADMICHYNPRGWAFAETDGRLAGALGPRLFGAGDRLPAAIDRLRRDPQSRRAVVPVFGPEHAVDVRDVPCTLDLQFLVRQSRLDCVVTVRSQSTLMMLPYDLFQFRGLHHLAADMLGLPAGRYVHQAGSLHVYDDEVAAAREALSAGVRDARMAAPKWAPAAIGELLGWERRLRTAAAAADAHEVTVLTRSAVPAVDFWGLARILFAAHALAAVGRTEAAAESLACLPDEMVATALARLGV